MRCTIWYFKIENKRLKNCHKCESTNVSGPNRWRLWHLIQYFTFFVYLLISILKFHVYRIVCSIWLNMINTRLSNLIAIYFILEILKASDKFSTNWSQLISSLIAKTTIMLPGLIQMFLYNLLNFTFLC